MSSNLGVNRKNSALTLEDILKASEAGIIAPPRKPGKRSRRRNLTKNLTQASMIAPLLAAEGCLTLGGNDAGPISDAVSDPNSSGGGNTPPGSYDGPVDAMDDQGFTTHIDSSVQIAAEDLLVNDAHAQDTTLELVRVFGASNGTVTLNNGIITFTPDAGFEGPATFQYEVRDSDGNLSNATVEIDVVMHDGGDGGDGGDTNHPPHTDDPAKTHEHMAALNLVPTEEATHVAAHSGSWFDPSTWENGEVPGEGAKVWIPEGIDVAYDGESPVSLFTVRVDGGLDFATDVNTFMEVDTLLVTPKGRMTIGTIDNPVAANVETVIQFADNGPIDTTWDPLLLSRGFIGHGDIQIHGAEKDAFLKVAIDPMAGDTSLTLESPPDGWKVGDKLVLTGTHLTHSETVAPGDPRDDKTEDEELIITSIDGNVIHFDKPLQYDHEGPRADLKAYVANYSRNVRFETENADSVPVHQRGHVMFMHTDNVDVRYAEFFELGRTDKSERAFDVADLTDVEPDTNIKARYSLHIHRAGVDDLDDPVMLVGNAVWGSPGWGYVHHDSNAVLTDNAAYNVFGAGFVAETGNETGRWSHNISIKSIGVGGGAKWHEDVQAFDLGRTGTGFWFQGRMVDAIDNVAAGVPGGHGFVYMSRGNGTIKVDPDTADYSESLRYLDEVFVNYPAISQFDNNEAFAVSIGLEVIKHGSEQQHDIRSVIEDFIGWEVNTGIHLQYTAHYTIINADLIGTDQSSGANEPFRGIEFGPNSFDNTINGATIAGFPTGVHASKIQINHTFPFDGDWGYVLIDVSVLGADVDFYNLSAAAGDMFLTGGDLIEGRLQFDSDIDNIPVTPTPESRGYIDLTGVKTDAIGKADVSPTYDPSRITYFNIRNALVEEGYWTLPDGRKVTAIDQYFTDRATGMVDKVTVFVEWERDFSDTSEEPRYNGVLDLNSDAPVTRTDFASVAEGDRVTIDVLANDFDPDGDELAIDGIIQPDHGSVFVNDNGTLTYAPDPNFSGSDQFWYWAEDEHGNFTKGLVNVTVEI